MYQLISKSLLRAVSVPSPVLCNMESTNTKTQNLLPTLKETTLKTYVSVHSACWVCAPMYLEDI